MAVADTAPSSPLHAAIRLTIALVEGLHHSARVEWPEQFQFFVARLKASGMRDRRVMAALLDVVLQEMQRGSGVQQERLFAKSASIEDMLGQLEYDIRVQTADFEVTSGRASRVRRVAIFIERHYAEPLTLKSLASIVGLNRASLATEFRRETGITVHEFLTRVRIRRAADLLQRGDKIEPVIMLVGYRGKKNFYRHFKKQLGMTPGEFKERQLRPVGA